MERKRLYVIGQDKKTIEIMGIFEGLWKRLCLLVLDLLKEIYSTLLRLGVRFQEN